MDFISIAFILFVSLVVFLYFVLPKKVQWVVLLTASYVFYFISCIQLSVFLIASTLVTFFASVLIGKINENQAVAASVKDWLDKDKRIHLKAAFRRKKRIILICALIINFSMLAVLKYFNFLADNINSVFNILSVEASIPHLDLLMPLGISFYIFQSSGYMIDVYRGKYAPDKNLAKYALFVSFFPQIIQGPIGRYDSLARQLTTPHKFSSDSLKSGFQLMLWGYFKKLVIADRIVPLVATVYGSGGKFGFFVNSVAILAYGIQIYCDFSGGIDIARGIAEVMGIQMAQNFRRPYFATTISGFWRRWHITLGNWVKDYVFFPLVLSKGMAKVGLRARKSFGDHFGKVLPACIATMVCFLIIGVWHGAAWKYVFYGLYYGSLISLSQFFNPFFGKVSNRLNINRHSQSWGIFGMLRTLFLVSIGRCIVRGGGFMDGFNLLKSSLTHWDPWTLFDGTLLKLGLSQYDFNVLLVGILILLVVDILQEKGYGIREVLNRQNVWLRASVAMGAIIAVVIFGVYGSNYSASDFIYAGF